MLCALYVTVVVYNAEAGLMYGGLIVAEFNETGLKADGEH